MTARDYLRIFRTRWRSVLAVLLLVTAAAGGYALTTPRQYSSSVQLFVSTTESTSDGNGLNQGAQFAQQRVQSYVQLVTSEAVTSAAIRQLGLTMTPQALASRITAQASLDTVLLDVSVQDPSPTQAQRLADAVTTAFLSTVDRVEESATGGAAPVQVRTVLPATLPVAPVSPNVPVDLALALIAGLGLGLVVAVVRESFDSTVRTAAEVRDLLGVPTLGVLAEDPSCRRRPLLGPEPGPGRGEELRQIRTALQFADGDTVPPSLVVTSAVSDEGKTSTAADLALSLVSAGTRVLLVDADLRYRGLSEHLGLGAAPGLTEVLLGSAELDEVLQPWGTSGLVVLSAGAVPPNPSELLTGQRMGDLLAQLESRCDVVLLDAPPLLPFTDAAVLAHAASGALLVLRTGRTTRDQARSAADLLDSVSARLFGVIPNRMARRDLDGRTRARRSASFPRSDRAASARPVTVVAQRVADVGAEPSRARL